MKQEATIFNIQKYSLHDGPGIRSIVFMKGCPLSCKWCANPESNNPFPELMFYPDKCIGCGKCLNACASGAIIKNESGLTFNRQACCNCGECAKVCPPKARKMIGEKRSIESVKKDVDKDVQFYINSNGGITFSGGEPMLYPEFIKELAEDYKRRNLSVVVETSGHVLWENFRKILDSVNLIMFDLKFIDSQKHLKYCGSGNDLILDNLKRIVKCVDTIVRIPIIPGINDTSYDLEKAGEFLAQIKGAIKGVHCLPYHNYGIAKYDALGRKYTLDDIPVPGKEYMESVKDAFGKYGITVQIGG